MLNQEALNKQLKEGFSAIFKNAFETCLLNSFPNKSDIGAEYAKNFAETFDNLVSDELAILISTSIDAYIKNAAITGTIITAGTPGSQTATIKSLSVPTSNGTVPNTLGIS